MSKEIRLVCDLDGVLFDFNTHFITLARTIYPDCKCPDASTTFPVSWGYMLDYVSKPRYRALWNTVMHDPQFWETCPTYAHSDELLVTVQARSQKLYFVTARSGVDVQKQTYNALHRVAPGLKVHGAIIPVVNHQEKIGLIQSLRATHFLDDRPETLDMAWEQCLNTNIAVWDQPWNRGNVNPAIPRLASVADVDRWLGE